MNRRKAIWCILRANSPWCWLGSRKISVGIHNGTSRSLKRSKEQEMLRAYYRMLQEGLRPGIGILVAALKACGALKQLRTGRKIHMEAVETGDCSHMFVGNTLIDMYAKCGSMVQALGIFQSMVCRDAISWNCLIMGYAQNGEGDTALQFYDRMLQDKACLPDAVTFLAGLKACCSSTQTDEARLRRGRSIHLQAAQAGQDRNAFVASTLVDFYTKCGSLLEAREVFERMPVRSVVVWTAIIHGYVHAGEGEQGLELYSRMQEEGCSPNDWTFVAAIKACSTLADIAADKRGKELYLDKGIVIHSQAAKGGRQLDMFVASSLVDMYVKCGSVVEARKVFDSMKSRDVVSWTAMILGYAEDDGKLALQLYRKMRDEGCAPNDVTFVAVMKACSSSAEKEEGKLVEGQLVKMAALQQAKATHHEVAATIGPRMKTFVYNTLIDMYSKCGSLVDALQVFESIPRKDVVSWNCIITGCGQCRQASQAMLLYTKMVLDEECQPNAATFVAALKACGSVGALDSGRRIEDDLCRAGMQQDLTVANSLVDFYGRCGSMVDAERVFASVAATRNLVTWTSLMAGYSRLGDAERVFGIFEDMKKQRIRPDAVTFVSILAVCSHAGLVEKGRECFQAMHSEFGIVPDVGHYNCMIDLFGRANRLQEAVAMVETMPFAPVKITWMSLLDAGRKWNNLAVAKVAFDAVVTLGGDHSAAYLMLSKVYDQAKPCTVSAKQDWSDPEAAVVLSTLSSQGKTSSLYREFHISGGISFRNLVMVSENARFLKHRRLSR